MSGRYSRRAHGRTLLKTKAGRSAYALLKQTVEPVPGIIKSALGLRRFLLRGLNKVSGEWRLTCLARNLKRMAPLRPKLEVAELWGSIAKNQLRAEFKAVKPPRILIFPCSGDQVRRGC